MCIFLISHTMCLFSLEYYSMVNGYKMALLLFEWSTKAAQYSNSTEKATKKAFNMVLLIVAVLFLSAATVSNSVFFFFILKWLFTPKFISPQSGVFGSPAASAIIPQAPIAATAADATHEDVKVLTTTVRKQFRDATNRLERNLGDIVLTTTDSLDILKPDTELKSAYMALFKYMVKSAAQEFKILEEQLEEGFLAKITGWLTDHESFDRVSGENYFPLMSEVHNAFGRAYSSIDNVRDSLFGFAQERFRFKNY